MNFKLIFSSFLFTVICFVNLNAQNTKYYYFDQNWQLTTWENCTYFRKVELNANGNYVNPIVDYYKNGEVQCIIKADYFKLTSGDSFLNSGGKNGEIAFFDRYGELQRYDRYSNGLLIDSQGPQAQNGSDWTTQDVIDGVNLAMTAWQVYKFFKGK